MKIKITIKKNMIKNYDTKIINSKVYRLEKKKNRKQRQKIRQTSNDIDITYN